MTGRHLTAGVNAVPITSNHRSPHPRRNGSAGSTDINRLTFGAEDDAGELAVTGEHLEIGDRENDAVLRFVQTTATAMKRSEVGVNQDMGLLRPRCIS
jgi:hypothetical protein